MSSPRIGIERPSTNSVMTITTNGTASSNPCLPHSGHHDLVLDRNCSSDCTTPRARAPISAIHTELSRAIKAAARAGTTRRVRLAGVSTPIAWPAMIMMNVTNTVARTHVTIPRLCGDRRANDAARSFSAAAWMARPVRERRNQNASAAPSTTTSPISHMRSMARLAPPSLTVPLGSTVVVGRASVPYFSDTAACRVSMMPTAATTLASTGAVRSGRDTTICTTAPRIAATPSAIRTETHVGGTEMSNAGNHGSGRCNLPCFRSLYTYSGTVAIAAAAKLMTPVPWYVTTMPMASDA